MGYTFYVNEKGAVAVTQSKQRRERVQSLSATLASIMKTLLPLYRKRSLSFGTIYYIMGIQIVINND